MKRIFIVLLFIVGITMPTMLYAQSIEELTDIFWNKTSCRNLTEARRSAMVEMQKYADDFTHTRSSMSILQLHQARMPTVE